MKPTKSIYILLSLFLIFSCEDNSVEPIVCDERSSNWGGVMVVHDGECVCDEGYTEIDEECYYQSDLDVLQDIIDINESLSGEEPLEIGSQLWVDGRLDSLSLRQIQLTTLPESIGDLSSLKLLDLSYNQLTTLPESIGNLSSLRWLYLEDSQLTTLPESIGNLSSLYWLRLSSNQLTTLPESIGNLSNLGSLELQNNQLTSIPESIGDLSSLEGLYLFNNQLTILPESICNLRETCNIIIYNNQLCEEYHYDCIDDYEWGEQECGDCCDE